MKQWYQKSKDYTRDLYRQTADASARFHQGVKNLGRFVSDGCTGVPDFIFSDCCKMHDYHYSIYGMVSRLDADLALLDCMRRVVAQKQKWYLLPLPWIYFIGVRLLGAGRYLGEPPKKDDSNG